MRTILLITFLSITSAILAQNHKVKCSGCSKYLEEGTLRNGVKEGNWKYYYGCAINHPIKEEGNYVNGKKTGIWKSYSPHRYLHTTTMFENGVENGESTGYYQSGKISSKSNFEKGKLVGESKQFDENGRIQSITIHEKGEFRSYHPNGKLKETGYVNSRNEKEGTWKEYHENGNLKSVGSYYKREKTDKWQEYHLNGKLKSEGEMNGIKRVGKWQFYHDNGQLQGSGEYAADGYPKPNSWVTYDRNGKRDEVNAPEPTKDQIIGLVYSVYQEEKYEGPYKFGFIYQEYLWKMAGADPKEYLSSYPVKKYEELQLIPGYQKVTRFWNQYKTSFHADGYSTSLATGKNILKFVADSRFTAFLLDGIKRYRFDFNFIDPVDGETVLDYVSYRIDLEKKMKPIIPEKIQEYERIYKMLRDYGVKYAKELK